MNYIPEDLADLSVTTVVPLTSLDAPGVIGIRIQSDVAVRVGGLGVTTTTGTVLNAGERMTIDTKHPNKWGIVSVSGTATVNRTLLKGTR